MVESYFNTPGILSDAPLLSGPGSYSLCKGLSSHREMAYSARWGKARVWVSSLMSPDLTRLTGPNGWEICVLTDLLSM